MKNNIKTIRKNAKMTQEELAVALGVNRATVSKYENGEITLSLPVLKKIAQVLNVKNWVDLFPEDEQAGAIVGAITNGLKEAASRGDHFEKVPDWKVIQAGARNAIRSRYGELNTDGRLKAGEYLLSFLLDHLDGEEATEVFADISRSMEELAKIPQYQQFKDAAKEGVNNG